MVILTENLKSRAAATQKVKGRYRVDISQFDDIEPSYQEMLAGCHILELVLLAIV